MAALPSYCPQQGAEVLRWSRRQENCGGCRGLFNLHPAAIHNFDIDRENISEEEFLLPLPEMRPNKIAAFESELEHLLRNGRLADELQVMQVCFEHGVKRQHATPVLSRLKLERVIELDFRVPDIRRLDSPRPIRLSRS